MIIGLEAPPAEATLPPLQSHRRHLDMSPVGFPSNPPCANGEFSERLVNSSGSSFFFHQIFF
jgi:hypothetical protein